MKHYWLYVLKLEQDKYYVGITSKTPEVRLQQHRNGFMAAKWVQKYKPIEIIESVELGDMSLEDVQQREKAYTLVYMKKYGYQNVRGADLNYSGKYIKIGETLWRSEKFQAMIALIVMTVAFIVVVVSYFIK